MSEKIAEILVKNADVEFIKTIIDEIATFYDTNIEEAGDAAIFELGEIYGRIQEYLDRRKNN